MKWLKRLIEKLQEKEQVFAPSENETTSGAGRTEATGKSDLDNIRSMADGYERHDLGQGVYFVCLGRSHACWLYNEATDALLPLVTRNGSVLFLKRTDLESGAVELIERECPGRMMSADFRFWVYPFKEGKAQVEWTVRPDGRYWADEDGYGMTDDEEISLRGEITADGRPVGLFRLSR